MPHVRVRKDCRSWQGCGVCAAGRMGHAVYGCGRVETFEQSQAVHSVCKG